jgi:two-component system sensor histidine kinase UhpB
MNTPPAITARLQGVSRSDGAWVAAGTLAAFALASSLQLQERLSDASAGWERWQIDELPMTLVALATGLVWYGWRRRRESLQLLARNRELTQQLLQLQDAERRAIARELHDEMGQHCTALRMEAAYIGRVQEPAQIMAAAGRVTESAGLLQEGVRRLLQRLRPAELDELGLPEALHALCAGWQSRSALRFALDIDSAAHGLGDAADSALYRVAQEALSNVVRHAQASQVQLRLAADATGITLVVADNGRGLPAQPSPRGLGLLGAGERAAALGGRFDIHSQPGHGTRLRLWLPRGACA